MYHINAPMLSIVDLVVSHNGAAVGSDLDSRQGVTIDVITLYQTSSISKYVDPSLVTIKYSISPGNKGKNNFTLEIDAKNDIFCVSMCVLHVMFPYHK